MGRMPTKVKKSAREFAMAKSESHVYLSWIVSSDMDLRVVIKDPQRIVIQIASYQAKGDDGLVWSQTRELVTRQELFICRSC